jgi:hypothetical protein
MKIWQTLIQHPFKLIGRKADPEPSPEEVRIKKLFAAKSPEDKMKVIGPQLDLYVSAVSSKADMLPQIAVLAATLIIIATLSKDVLALSVEETKWILSFFLVVIPVSLHIGIKQKEWAAQNALRVIKSYHLEDPYKKLEESFSFWRLLGSQAMSDYQILVTYGLYLVVALALLKMWV